jgi:hypothetical protein
MSVDSARRYLLSAEYRDLPPLEKAIKLIEDKHCGLREAARLTGVDKNMIGRARIAIAEGRSIGVVGRPKALGDEGELKLVAALDEARENQEPLSYKEVKHKVYFC